MRGRKKRVPIGQAFNPQQGSPCRDIIPAGDGHRAGIVGGDDLQQLALCFSLRAHQLDEALPIFEVGRRVSEVAHRCPARPSEVAGGARAHLHQADGARRTDDARAEIAFLAGMGEGQRGSIRQPQPAASAGRKRATPGTRTPERHCAPANIAGRRNRPFRHGARARWSERADRRCGEACPRPGDARRSRRGAMPADIVPILDPARGRQAASGQRLVHAQGFAGEEPVEASDERAAARSSGANRCGRRQGHFRSVPPIGAGGKQLASTRSLATARKWARRGCSRRAAGGEAASSGMADPFAGAASVAVSATRARRHRGRGHNRSSNVAAASARPSAVRAGNDCRYKASACSANRS